MNTSDMFTLNWTDLGKGLVVAILTVILGALQQAITGHGINFASYDWGGMLNIAVSAGVAYLAKNFISDSDGKVLGSLG